MPNELGAGEVAAHHVTCGPFRVWCSACMTSRCFAAKHIVSDEHEYDSLAVVGNDFAFMEDEDDNPLMIMMVQNSCGSKQLQFRGRE